MSAKLQQVHVRVNDAATGKPTPCRVRFTDQQNYYAPHGRTSQVPDSFWRCRRDIAGYLSDEETWAFVDGSFEIDLPAGPINVAIEKGHAYQRLDQQIHLTPGKLALRFDLERRFDPAQDGWYAGAMARTALSPHDVLLEGAAEGLRVVDLLAYEREATIDGVEHWPVWRALTPEARPPAASPGAPDFETLVDYPNLIAFSGQRPCLETQDCLVAVNTGNRHALLGELALLNCHRVVFPLRFGRSSLDRSAHHRPDNWSLADWCDQCHRKRGLVIGLTVHWSERDPWYGGEGLADLILGKIDAIGYLGKNTGDWWYTLLSLGLRVPIVSSFTLRPLGYCRTYARVQPNHEFTYASWIEAIRAGRTVVSWGPYLTLTANDQDPGACIDLDNDSVVVNVRAQAKACLEFEFDELQVVHDGKVVMAVHRGGAFQAVIDCQIQVTQSGWLAARCVSHASPHRDSCEAHTSPIYLHVNHKPPPVDPDAVRTVTDLLDRTLVWVEHDADCETPKDRERLTKVFVDAKQVLLGKLAN